MSESTPSPVPVDSAGGDSQALSPAKVERILADFRSWLEQDPPKPPSAAPAETVDLATLVAQFTALRHEVNLQTRASRNLQEQVVKSLERTPAAEPEEAIRPLIKGLIEIHDALAHARREVQRSQQQLNGSAENPQLPPAPTLKMALPWWKRLFGQSRHIQIDPKSWRRYWRDHFPLPRDPSAQNAATVTAIIAGYTMSLERLQRLLDQHGLEAIDPRGQVFDPETMEVLDVVLDAGQPSGTVMEVLRPGYTWNKRIFRFAQVRVSRQP